MTKMNHWRTNKVYGRPTLDFRYEHFVPDRAEKWLRVAERRQVQRRQQERPRNRKRRSLALASSH
jgi:hypothetical protein